MEYFNTIVIQPHKKLVTNQGRGYHVRCRYPIRETAIISGIDVRYRTFHPLNTHACFDCLRFDAALPISGETLVLCGRVARSARSRFDHHFSTRLSMEKVQRPCSSSASMS